MTATELNYINTKQKILAKYSSMAKTAAL